MTRTCKVILHSPIRHAPTLNHYFPFSFSLRLLCTLLIRSSRLPRLLAKVIHDQKDQTRQQAQPGEPKRKVERTPIPLLLIIIGVISRSAVPGKPNPSKIL
jgi:hypothetical protein